jgi:hypothetical protein
MTPAGIVQRNVALASALAPARALLLACCLAGTAAIGAAVADAPPAVSNVERGVKAAFLYKFLAYVDYPQSLGDGGAPYVIGVAGAEDIAAELTRITAGRSVNRHPVQVRTVRSGDTLAGVHLLFIGAGEGARAAPLLHAAQEAGTLSVSETPGALQAGSVINFRLVDDHVRFEVSLEAAEKNNLKLSSRLLSVAYAVQKGGS